MPLDKHSPSIEYPVTFLTFSYLSYKKTNWTFLIAGRLHLITHPLLCPFLSCKLSTLGRWIMSGNQIKMLVIVTCRGTGATQLFTITCVLSCQLASQQMQEALVHHFSTWEWYSTQPRFVKIQHQSARKSFLVSKGRLCCLPMLCPFWTNRERSIPFLKYFRDKKQKNCWSVFAWENPFVYG
jgi:hypothetical protein